MSKDKVALKGLNSIKKYCEKQSCKENGCEECVFSKIYDFTGFGAECTLAIHFYDSYGRYIEGDITESTIF